MTTSTACVALLAMVITGAANAERLPGPDGQYSFDLPAGWKQLPQDAYTVDGPNNEVLLEMAAPKKARSIGEIARAMPLVAEAFGFDKLGKKDVTLDGPNWQGIVTFARGKYGDKPVKSTLMALVVRGPKGFFMFWLVASDREFAKHEAEYMAMFKSLEFASDAAAPPAEPAPAQSPTN